MEDSTPQTVAPTPVRPDRRRALAVAVFAIVAGVGILGMTWSSDLARQPYPNGRNETATVAKVEVLPSRRGFDSYDTTVSWRYRGQERRETVTVERERAEGAKVTISWLPPDTTSVRIVDPARPAAIWFGYLVGLVGIAAGIWRLVLLRRSART